MGSEELSKGERTWLAIEEAAYELFLGQGYSATSMRQIADRAGIALGGIYNHFKSKDEIFESIIINKHPYKKLLPGIMAAEGEDIEEFTRNAMRLIVEEMGDNPYYVNLMLIEIVEFKGKHGAKLLDELTPKVFPLFEKLVKTRKNFRVTNPALLLRAFFGLILSYFLTEMIIRDSVVSSLMPKNAAEAYMDIFLHGVLKEKDGKNV
ncbi:MAG: TetR/AcrR family transcriptional regulator [Anaerolineales bacterium]|nr:TetR/AcrR family transcriptional regulator [Anaerolineales bacterium]